MDPSTVIIILATHLICSGGLYYLISRDMPPRSGLVHWAAGGVLFGVAYIARLFVEKHVAAPWTVAMDSAMVLAALLFLAGLRQFTGRSAGRWYLLVGVIGVYATAHLAVTLQWGGIGRHVLLNATLGLVYLALAVEALRTHSAHSGRLRSPLRVLTVLMGLLSLLALARAGHVAWQGLGVLYTGIFAQVFYGYASLAAVLLGLNLVWLVFVRLNSQLIELASRDALTRLLNRNGLDELVMRHFAARDARPITLLQIDIDHFKRINDSHGHAAGDRMLREVATALAAHVRASDFIARVGGEEFLVGCVAADDGVARALAERLLAGVRKLDVRLPGVKVPLHCTVSIGISRRCGDLTAWERCWAEADRALYAAKAAGRDRVVSVNSLGADLR